MTITARIPLLRDHHTHPFLYSSLARCTDIGLINDKNRALELIEAGCRADEINAVTGWNDSRYLFGENELNSLPPLVILNSSLHFFIMNRAATERLAPRFPGLAENLDNRDWIERRCAQLLGFIMGLKPCDAGQLRSFFDALALQGVWYAEEMSLAGAEEIAACAGSGLLDRTGFWADPASFQTLEPCSRERVLGIKLFTDGALGARTARLSLPFLSGEQGVLVYGDEQLQRQLSRIAEMGLAVAIHAIGDSAIAQAVRVLGRLERKPPLIRIEHCQFISPESAVLAKDLGITLCMQPNFSGESTYYTDRLPDGFPERNNPFRMLIDQAGFAPGKDLLFGSDGMPHGARQALRNALFPPCPGQRLTLEEFVAGYCMPDDTNGYIDLTIDRTGRDVIVQIKLSD